MAHRLILSALLVATPAAAAPSPCEAQADTVAKLRAAVDREARADKSLHCFESHYQLSDFGCPARSSDAEAPLLRAGSEDGKSHISPKIAYKHIEPVKSVALDELQAAMRASVGICAAEEQYQSTNYKGVVTCFHADCSPIRLTHKSAMTGGVSVEAKEIEAGRDTRMGLGFDEVYRLS